MTTSPNKGFDPDIIEAITVGLRELPFLIRGVETVFGKETGETKKQAVQDLVLGAISGVSMGFGVSGNQQMEQTVDAFAPTISNLTDIIVAGYNDSGVFQHSASTQAQTVTAPPPGSSPGAGQPA